MTRNKQRVLTAAAGSIVLGLLLMVVGVAPAASATPTIASIPQAQPQQAPAVDQVSRSTTRTVVLRAQPNDGVIRLTIRACGNSNGWQSVAAANHIYPPVYRVWLYQAVTIACGGRAGPVSSTQQAAPAAPAVVTSSGWTSALPGYCRSGNANYGQPRPGHDGIWGTADDYAHQGGDYPRATGTAIHSIGAGKVTYAGYAGRYAGNQIQIQHANGVLSKYNHLKVNGFAVHSGQYVGAGQVIGYVGATGDATGPHLHLEIWVYGHLQNPGVWLKQRGVNLMC